MSRILIRSEKILEKAQYKGHFREGPKEEGPMQSSILTGKEYQIGPKAFR